MFRAFIAISIGKQLPDCFALAEPVSGSMQQSPVLPLSFYIDNSNSGAYHRARQFCDRKR